MTPLARLWPVWQGCGVGQPVAPEGDDELAGAEAGDHIEGAGAGFFNAASEDLPNL